MNGKYNLTIIFLDKVLGVQIRKLKHAFKCIVLSSFDCYLKYLIIQLYFDL